MATPATKLGRLKVIRVGLETTAGTAVTPAVELLAFEPTCNGDDNLIQREPSGLYGGQATAALGPQTGKASITTELRSNGTSALDAGVLALLQACGLKLTTGVLAPCTALASQKTVTIHVWEDGRKKELSGAAGTCRINGEFGQRVMLEFEFSGIYTPLGDEAMPTPTQTAVMPMLAKSATFSIGGVPLATSVFGIDINGPVEQREDISAPQGVRNYYVGAGRRWMASCQPEVPAAATYDPDALAAAGTTGALSLVLTDGTVDVTIEAPAMQFMPPASSTRGSKLVYELQGQLNADDGDDELTITAAAHT